MAEGSRGSKGYGRYASLAAATKLTDAPTAGVAAPDGAYSCLIQNQHASVAIRWRDDGVAPTATEGMILAAGVTLEYDGDLDKFQMIQAAASGVVAVSYYGF